jgi:hypothetical protein
VCVVTGVVSPPTRLFSQEADSESARRKIQANRSGKSSKRPRRIESSTPYRPLPPLQKTVASAPAGPRPLKRDAFQRPRRSQRERPRPEAGTSGAAEHEFGFEESAEPSAAQTPPTAASSSTHGDVSAADAGQQGATATQEFDPAQEEFLP